jgi:acetyl esterase/lipase
MTRMVVVVLLLWTGCCAVAARGAEPKLDVQRNITFHQADGEKLQADLYRLADAELRPAVILIHGGGWATGDKWNMADHACELARAGFVVFNINYRLAPKHKFPAQVDDCRAALKWVATEAAQYRIDTKRIGVYGYSAGAHLAALLACNPTSDQPAIKAVVAGGAPCDFSELELKNRTLAYWLGGSRAEKPDVYKAASPKLYASPEDPPFFFFHGDEDGLVPLHNSRCLHDELQKCGIESEFMQVDGQGHLMTFINQEARTKAVEFLKKHL